MAFRYLPIFSLLICLMLTACSTGPSPETQEKIATLKAELDDLQMEIEIAELETIFNDTGLLEALVKARLEILTTTEALLEQRIHALESGAEITINVYGTEPNPELADQLKLEISQVQTDLEAAKEDAAGSSRGLVAVMKHTTVATYEQTLAMLKQQYLQAQYGLPAIQFVLPAEADSQQLGEPSSYGSEDGLLTDIVSVRLLSKRFDEQDYNEYIWFNIQFEAVGLDQSARAIKGVLKLQDLFGETRLRLNWTIDEPVQPGQTITETGTGFEYNQFRDTHRWVRTTDIKNMTASFEVTSILYDDGSRRDF